MRPAGRWSERRKTGRRKEGIKIKKEMMRHQLGRKDGKSNVPRRDNATLFCAVVVSALDAVCLAQRAMKTVLRECTKKGDAAKGRRGGEGTVVAMDEQEREEREE